MKMEEQDCYGLMVLKKNRHKPKKCNQAFEEIQKSPQMPISNQSQPQSLSYKNNRNQAKISQVIRDVVHVSGPTKKNEGPKDESIGKNQPNRQNTKRKPKKGSQKNQKSNENIRAKSCSLKQKLSDIEQTQEEDEKELDEIDKQNQLKSSWHTSDYFLVGFVRNSGQLKGRKSKAEKRIKSCIKHDIKIFSESRNRHSRNTY